MAVPLFRFSLSSKLSLVSPFLKHQLQFKVPLNFSKHYRQPNFSSTAAFQFTKTMATNATTNDSEDSQQQQQQEVSDIEDFHRVHEDALSRAEGTYIDPETGYTVFTELTHLKRGKCCGNRCRHCPYGFEKVRPPGGYRRGAWRSRRANSKLDPDIPPPPLPVIPGAPAAKLKSGDMETAERMVREILQKAGKEDDFGTVVPRNRRSVTRKEESNDQDDDVSSAYSSSSSSYSSSSVSSAETEEHDNNQNHNTQDEKPTSITVIKDHVIASTSSAATTASTTTESSNSRGGLPTKNVPYTRSGDQGTSQLGTGERRSKTDDAFEAMGTVDELCSFVGVAHSHLLNTKKYDYGELPVRLLDVMSRLFDVGSHVAKPPKSGGVFVPNGIGDGFDASHVDDLEEWINEMTEDLPELTSFILPTGAPASAALHVARTVCRRAERRLVPLVVNHQTCDPNALRYLNRLSDFFFVSARWVNYREKQEEIEYKLDIYDAKNSEDQRERVVRSLAATDNGEKN